MKKLMLVTAFMAIAGAVCAAEKETADKPATTPQIQAPATITERDKELIIYWAIHDLEISSKKGGMPRRSSACMDKCLKECEGGGGDCFKACKADGYSFSYCRSSCGQVRGCYEACKADGYSFSYCNSSCGKMDGCYEACKADGYSFSYCNTSCGKIDGCYEACKADGYSFSYCNSSCK